MEHFGPVLRGVFGSPNAPVRHGPKNVGAQVVWIRILRTTCCSQFDSNTKSEAQASEVSTVGFP
eukprot:scaffold44555_cov58-Phaeocystis_antarctica.AAC.4